MTNHLRLSNLTLQLFSCCVVALAFTGCRHTVSQYDAFEKVQVHRMVGNSVGQPVFSRTVICLNAMREVRWPGPVTNQTVTFLTNHIITSITNQTISTSSQDQAASNTNAVGLALNLQLPDDPPETNSITAPSQSPDSAQAGETVSLLRNESIATAPNQSVISKTLQRTAVVNNQTTVNTNNAAYVLGSTQIMTTETNWVITTTTNLVVTSVTNATVTAPVAPVIDYYLYTEIAPQDFALASGENLVLLIDGVRASFAPTTPLSGLQPRRGYLTTYYKVPAEALIGIANSHEVRFRVRGASTSLERALRTSDRNKIRNFLLENPAGSSSEASVASSRI